MDSPLPPPTIRSDDSPPRVKHFPDELRPPPGPVNAAFCDVPPMPLTMKEWKAMFLDALTYPTRGDGWYILIPGALLGFGTSVAVSSGFARIGSLLILGYCFAYFVEVIRATVTGKDAVPDWPGLGSLNDDIAQPVVASALATAIAALPCWIWSTLDVGAPGLWPFQVVQLCCFAYVPFALLSFSIHDTLRSVLPDVVLPAIWRVKVPFCILLGGLLGCLLVIALIGAVLGLVPFLGIFVSALAAIYSQILYGRLLGLFYREHRNMIGWGV